jgi:hypothetical protein
MVFLMLITEINGIFSKLPLAIFTMEFVSLGLLFCGFIMQSTPNPKAVLIIAPILFGSVA